MDFSKYQTCCTGLKYPAIRELHAENCPSRKDAYPLYRENPSARRTFDHVTKTLHPGKPLLQVAYALDTEGRMAPEHGSYRQDRFIFANECIKAHLRIDELEAKLRAAGIEP